jgi:hypothetical protein
MNFLLNEAHAEVMKGNAALSEEDKKAKMGKWMAENKARFDAA